MPLFAYTALAPSGQIERGWRHAPGMNELDAHLLARQRELLGARILKSSARHYDLPLREAFFFNLEQLLRAGIPLLEALESMRQHAASPALESLLARLVEALQSGHSLAEALRELDGFCNEASCALLAAGEHSGNLPAMLDALREQTQQEITLRASLRRITAYPACVALIALLAVSLALSFLVPELARLFHSSGLALPWQTRLLLGISSVFRSFGPALLLASGTAAVLFALACRQNPGLALRRDHLWLQLPLLGPLLQRILLARLLRLFALLYASGIPLMEGLGMLAATSSNLALRAAIEASSTRLRAGMGLGAAFANESVFPPLVLRMLHLGEQTGALERSLRQAVEVLQREAELGLTRLQTRLELGLLLGVGGLILWIALSVLGPVYDLISRLRI